MKIEELLSSTQQQQIREIAIAEYENGKRECCGLLLYGGDIVGCDNQAVNPSTEFTIKSSTYASLETKWGVRAIFHSHTNGNGNFSAADIDLVNRTQKPLILYSVETNEFKAVDPSGKTPLIGRDFVYGIYDCFSLVCDYYASEKQINLPHYPRSSDRPVWDAAMWDWIDTEYQKVGFVEVKRPEIGDVIAMSIGGRAKGINHLAVYTGTGKFLHQLSGRKSCEELWGAVWAGYTIKFLRFQGVPSTVSHDSRPKPKTRK